MEIQKSMGVIRNRKLEKKGQHNGQKDKQLNYKTLHRKLIIKIEQHEPHLKPGVNAGALEG
jgi:hypothetical protein